MKKLLSLIMASTLLLAGCSSAGGNSTTGKQDNKPAQQEAEATGKKYKIGITQISEHPALDSARNGFINQLKADGIDKIGRAHV